MTSGGGDTIGEPAPGRARVVAAFDFDGTLSTRDNFVPFLAEFAGGSTFVREMASAVLQVAGAGRAGWSRDELKAAALAHIMTGRRVDDFEATARRSAARSCATTCAPRRWSRRRGTATTGTGW
jgi:phosphatidylglycerophosphatase C